MKKTKEEILINLLDRYDLCYQFEPTSKFIDDGDCIFDAIFEGMDKYKDQELEELQAKYDKLKEAFDKMNVHFASTRWASKESQEKQINSWNKSAGLTE